MLRRSYQYRHTGDPLPEPRRSALVTHVPSVSQERLLLSFGLQER